MAALKNRLKRLNAKSRLAKAINNKPISFKPIQNLRSIAISRNTSLAIVAPGIAEALFATALGLLAAIPAVIAYNKFSNDSKKYSQKLENFSKRFISII